MASAPSSAPSLDVNSTLGALQIGVLVSCMLFGFSTNQTYLYYSRFQADDPPKIKYLVGFVWLCELAHSICIAHTLYIMTVSDALHPERLSKGPPPSLGGSSLFSATIALCVQGFFSTRIYSLSKKPYIPVLTWTLSILFLLGTLVTFITGLENHDLTLNETRWSWLYPSLWSIAAANDLIIAGALVFWFRSQRKEVPHATTALLDKIIAWTIETGVLTSTAAILNLICFVTMKDNLIWIAWYVVTARLYSNSFLSSLNSRVILRAMKNGGYSLPMSRMASPWPSFNHEQSGNFSTSWNQASTSSLPNSHAVKN